MRNLISALAIWLIVAPLAMAAAGKLQNADFATSAQITGAGGSVSQLLNSSKMFNSVDSEIMDTSIARWNAKLSSPVTFANGGTGLTATPANGQLAIGNGAGYSLANITQGSGVTITNGPGSITISASNSGVTVTSVSVVSANGLAGTVANPTTTPALTLSTTISGVLKGDGTAISAAVSGTDYQLPISSASAPANQFFNSFTAPNTFGSAQVSFNNLNGSISAAQMLALPSSQIYIGNGSGQPVAQTMSGAATITAGGVVTLSNTGVSAGSYTNANITVGADGRISVASSGSSGSSALAINTYTADQVVTNGNDVILMNCSSACTLTMQAVSAATIKPYRIKNIGTAVLTVAPNGADTFEGTETSIVMPSGGLPQPAIEEIPNGVSSWESF